MADSTTVEHRVSAEGADYLALAGVNDANLQELARLSSCRVILRGDNILLSGDVNDVERALPVAEQMVQQARIGQALDADDIRRFFSTETQRPRSQKPRKNGISGAAEDSQVLFAGLKKLIGSKSEGQRHYLDSIVNHDIVISIGPAGTGKTYLAVAAAVDALRKNRVKRIILARPAVEAGENLGFVRLLPLGDDLALTRPATVQIDREQLRRQFDARRAAVDDDDVARTVRFAGGRDPESLSKTVTRHDPAC